MAKSQKIVLLVIVVLAVLYFAIFFIPNLKGAKDATMLSVFEHDEFAQYPNLIQMFRTGASPLLTFKNFLTYQHYYYGYPFYFFSGLVLLPLKWILGVDWVSHTQILVALLRQLINVLPMLMAIFLLVREQLKSKSPWKALLTFLLILSLPAVVGNNLWWHPDSLLVFFSVLTILFLIRDGGKLGRFFYLSGVTCALAIGAKFLGALFIGTYLCYLIYAKTAQKQSWRKVLLSALLFLVAMLGTVVVSNPLILLPIERREIIFDISTIFTESAKGFYVAGGGFGAKLAEVVQVLNAYYGGVLLFIIALTNLVYGLATKKNVVKYLVILSWTVVFMSYFLFFASTLRPHYFIPVILPLYACLLDLMPEIKGLLNLKPSDQSKSELAKKIAALMVALLIIFQFGLGTVKAADTIKVSVQREETSGSLAMFRAFQEQVLPKIPEGTPLIIYRDWRAYVADNPHWRVIFNWDLASYDYIQANTPDLLFIEKENVLYFSDQSKLAEALVPEQMQQMYDFYSDVLHDKVKGFHLVYTDNFGYVFVSNSLFEKYFK